MIVGIGRLEAQVFMQRVGRFHVVQRVKQHALVAALAGGVQNALRQLPPQAKALTVSGRTPAGSGSRPRSRWERTQAAVSGPLARTGM